MVGGGYGDGIDMLVLFIQHLAVILVIFCRGEFGPDLGGATVVHITQYGDVRLTTAREIIDIDLAFSTDANSGDDQPVAGSYKTFATQHMPGNNINACCGRQSFLQKITPGIALS